MAGENEPTIEEQNRAIALEETVTEAGIVDPSLDVEEQPQPEPEEKPAEEKPADEKPAEEKPEDKKPEEKPKTLLETVKERDAELKKEKEEKEKPAEQKKEEAKPEEKPADKEQKSAEKDDGKKKDEFSISKAQWKSLPENVKERIGVLYRQNKSQQEQIEQLEPRVETLNHIHKFVTDSGLSQQEFADGLNLMAMRYKDPAGALEALTGIVNELRAEVGDVLPQDLQDKVDDGTIGEAEAKELSRARAAKARETAQAQTTQPVQQDPSAAAEPTAEMMETFNIIRGMEQEWLKTDADYALKSKQILEHIEWRIAKEGVPNTREGILKMVKESKAKIDQRVARRANMNLVEKKPVSAVSSNVQTKPVAKSAFEQCKIDEAERKAASQV